MQGKPLRSLASLRDVTEISLLRRIFNMEAKIAHAKINNAHQALVIMRSIDRRPNAQVPVNQPIQNFPLTPDAVSQMNGTFPF
jgi:hypothetical protein